MANEVSKKFVVIRKKTEACQGPAQGGESRGISSDEGVKREAENKTEKAVGKVAGGAPGAAVCAIRDCDRALGSIRGEVLRYAQTECRFSRG